MAPRFDPRALAPLVPRSLTVLVDVTNTCNLRCRMCYFSYDSVAQRRAIHMSPETFERVAASVFPFARTVLLSAGSEPLVHERFTSLLAIAARHAPQELKFLTNGQLLGAAIIDACIDHGVTEIHVSIDGATAETYEWVRRGGSFARLRANLASLRDRKLERGSALPKVQFNVTLMRCNVGELTLFAALARELGVAQLACRHVMPYEGLDMEAQALSCDKAAANAQLAAGLAAAAEAGVAVVAFPDFFELAETHAPPWEAVAPGRAELAQLGVETRLATAFGAHAAIRLQPTPVAAGVVVHAAPRAAPAVATPDVVANAPVTATVSVTAARESWAESLAEFARRLPDDPEHPFGRVDEPAAPALALREGLLLHGWALHRAGLRRVVVCREPRAGEPCEAVDRLGLIVLCDAVVHNGTRPDVAAVHASQPGHLSAGWSCRLPAAAVASLRAGDNVRLHVVAWGADERWSLLGSRRVLPAEDAAPRLAAASELAAVTAALYCRKPFTSLYIDAAADVYPYPDCQTVEPMGSLRDGKPLEEIWYAPALVELRRRIAEVEPPEMCRGCPDFINRHPDDPDYFAARRLQPLFRLPHGFIDVPRTGDLAGDTFEVAGWAIGFAPVERVELARLLADGGCRVLGDATLGVSRPDVGRSHRRYPAADRSGWSFLVRRAALLADGADARAPIDVHVRAHNAEGASVELGVVRLVPLPESAGDAPADDGAWRLRWTIERSR